MKFRTATTAAMLTALAFIAPAVASAAPATAPDVVGLTEGDAVATLQAEGIDVRIATRNGSCALTDQIVHHQQDLSGKETVKPIFGKKSRSNGTSYLGVVGYTTIVTPPSTTLNMTCP